MPASESPRQLTPHATVRAIEIPDPGPRPQRFKPIAPQVEVTVSPPTGRQFRAVIPAAEATPERLQALVGQAPPLSRLVVGPERGAIDITLQDARGATLKSGSLVLSRRGSAATRVPIDPATRRFRAGNIPAGRWEVRAVAAGHGRVQQTITVREQDTLRSALKLDGKATSGKVQLRFRVGGPARKLHVVAHDRVSGKLVFDRWVPVIRSGVTLAAVPHGNLHLEFIDGDGRSCYDADVNDITAAAVHELTIVPGWQLPVPEPDPPPWLALKEELDSVARLLPALGIRSAEQLASTRAEWLMHRMLEQGAVPVHTRLFDEAIEGAKQQLGVTPTIGAMRMRVRLAARREIARSFRLAAPGTVEFSVDLGAGGRGRIEIDGSTRKRTVTIAGRRTVAIDVSDRQWASNPVLRVRVLNQSGRRIDGVVDARLPVPAELEHALAPISTRDRIENILAALAPHNPGLAVTVPLVVLTPENIRGWLDRARTVMHQLGVCSINDLGTLRLDPNRVLERGAYVAPAKPPSDTSIVALQHYRLESVIGGTVLHYLPNDTIEEWAVIYGGVWDIRGQVIRIGQDVRELFVVVGKVLHDNGTVIMWEEPDLPTATTYHPSPAPAGGYHQSYGAHGEHGGDGDPNPHVSNNGGADAVTPAPTVTMYVLDATNGLPPILLIGQRGGRGGRGQDGGRGGDGFMGSPAEGTWFGGCCRGAGYGGHAGDGGDGGKGGRGGRGGRGGQITVLTTAAGINYMNIDPPLILCNPGAGGPGGWGGQGGSGGQGGPAGSADCGPCNEHPERRGNDGAPGASGPVGDQGSPGPPVHSDAIQFLPITREQWEQALISPHLLQIEPNRAEVGELITLRGANFDPSIDHVFFDGDDMGPVLTINLARFVVPSVTGTYHAVVIKPATPSDRLSNTVMLLVLPTLDAIGPLTRWEEGQSVEVTGDGFMTGCKLLAEDWSSDPATSFNLQVDSWWRNRLEVTIPEAPLGNLRGVRRLRVRNPSGATTQQEVVVRIGHRIIVRCAAFRLVGQDSGVTTSQTAAQIASMFVEGGFNALTHFWGEADISFQLIAPVKDVVVDDEIAECFPQDFEDNEEEDAALAAVAAAAPFVDGVINMVFCNDVEGSTMGFARFGGGPLVLGEMGDALTSFMRMKLAAHELGHALCLAHVCDEEGLPDCETWHMTSLMYPELLNDFSEQSSSGDLSSSEINRARRSATHYERGKTAALPVSTASSDEWPPQCLAGDTEN